MRSADKNDVDIAMLFRWKTEAEISDPLTGETYKLYIRLVGDADLNRAKVYGYRTSSDLRKRLRDKDSDERLSFIAEMEDYQTKDVLTQTIILLETPEIFNEAMKLATDELTEPREPRSDATHEKWEEYQTQIDNFEINFQDKIEDVMSSLQEKEQQRLSEYSMDDLHELYLNITINRLCEESFQNAFYDMCVYLGVYLDSEFKIKAFKSFDDYLNAHPKLKIDLRAKYRDLEMGIDLLKKLPEATEFLPSGSQLVN